VLGDGLLGHLVASGELTDGGVAFGEADDEVAADRVGEGGEPWDNGSAETPLDDNDLVGVGRAGAELVNPSVVILGLTRSRPR
jgi:hypothetical protein